MNNKDKVDLVQFINILITYKKEAEDKLNVSDYKSAILIYEKALDKSIEFLKDYKPSDIQQVKLISDINSYKKKFISNMALCYYKLEDYDKCIELDKALLSIDVCYDKAYARLYLCYKKKNLLSVAIEYGEHLLSKFDEKTLEKYGELVKEIKEQREDLNYSKKLHKLENFSKRYIPLIVGFILGCYFYFKKKEH